MYFNNKIKLNEWLSVDMHIAYVYILKLSLVYKLKDE